MRTIVPILTTLLAACTMQPVFDPRIPLDRGQMLRRVHRDELDNYKCRDGAILYAESVGGSFYWDIRCP